MRLRSHRLVSIEWLFRLLRLCVHRPVRCPGVAGLVVALKGAWGRPV